MGLGNPVTLGLQPYARLTSNSVHISTNAKCQSDYTWAPFSVVVLRWGLRQEGERTEESRGHTANPKKSWQVSAGKCEPVIAVCGAQCTPFWLNGPVAEGFTGLGPDSDSA